MKMLPKTSAPGQALPEYGLILVLLTVLCIAALQLMGETSSDFMLQFAGRFTNLTGG